MHFSSLLCCITHKKYSDSASANPTQPSKNKKGDVAPEPARPESLFKIYADDDDPSVIGPEGFERLCADASLPLEGALPLILSWQFGASEMAKITRAEWDAASTELRITSLQTLSTALHDIEDLLLLDKPPIKPPNASSRKTSASAEPYNRARYHRYALDKTKGFSELYSYCFQLAKPAQVRNIDIETAAAFWTVLVVPQHPIMSDVLDYINEVGTYKGVNKDLWTMMLEFCRTVKPDLSNYDSDGAWPTLLDDFIAWKKAKNGNEEAPSQA